LRKVAVVVGSLVAVALVAGIFYFWLILPTCTLQPRSEFASPDGRFVAVVDSRRCSEPENDWAMVTLRAPDRSEQAMVFRLLGADGPIAVRWAGWSRLEIRYPEDAKTYRSTQPQGWPNVQFLEVSDLE
jgi:hypothetical protein